VGDSHRTITREKVNGSTVNDSVNPFKGRDAADKENGTKFAPEDVMQTVD
jgi:large subunit ribosomal protein L26e